MPAPPLPLPKVDPRRADHLEFSMDFVRQDPDSMPFDIWSFVAMMGGFACLMLRSRVAGWVALFGCLVSAVTSRNSDVEPRQTVTSLSFAVMGLVMSYLNRAGPLTSLLTSGTTSS